MSADFPDRRYRELLQRSPAGLLVTTFEGDILEANRAAASVLGFASPGELKETNIRDRYQNPERREELMERLRREGAVENLELPMEDRDGNARWFLVSITVDYDEARGDVVLLTSWVDTTELRQLREELTYKARHDDLTNTLNRRALYQRGKQVLAMCSRQGRKAAVVYVDLVGFKHVNEQVGHRGGDEILKRVAQRLAETARESDLIARTGGDEFAVLCTQLKEERDAERAARRLLTAFREPFDVNGRQIRIQAAMGVSIYPEDGRELDTLVDRADQALWGADREKSPGLRRYRTHLEEAGDDTAWVRPELKRTLQTGPDFFNVYQPVVSAESEEVVGLEALIRWDHPEREVVPPAEFIPVAERSGLIREVDRWAFRAAVGQVAAWNHRNLPLDWLAVNLSAQSLSDPDFVELARETLDAHPDVRPGQIVIEITEHAAMQQVYEADVLDRLDDQVGLAIAIDDFGIGYSSLLYLRHLPADFLKIDMEFIHGLPDTEADRKVVNGILGLGEAFGLDLIAEGVETEAQRDWLRERGCPCLQGFLFGRPMEADEVERLVS